GRDCLLRHHGPLRVRSEASNAAPRCDRTYRGRSTQSPQRPLGPHRSSCARGLRALPAWVRPHGLAVRRTSQDRPRDQWAVAESLGVHIDLPHLSKNQRSKAKRAHPLVRWFEHLSILRNSSAHHARVWSRSFAPAPTAALKSIPALATLPEGQSERIHGARGLIAFLLGTVAPHSTWNLKKYHLEPGVGRLLSSRERSDRPSPGRLPACARIEPGHRDDGDSQVSLPRAAERGHRCPSTSRSLQGRPPNAPSSRRTSPSPSISSAARSPRSRRR